MPRLTRPLIRGAAAALVVSAILAGAAPPRAAAAVSDHQTTTTPSERRAVPPRAPKPAAPAPDPGTEADGRKALHELLGKRTRLYTEMSARQLAAILSTIEVETTFELQDGVPRLNAVSAGGRPFGIRLLGCGDKASDATPCLSMHMFAVFPADRAIGLAELNAFNLQFPFAKVIRIPNGSFAVERSITFGFGITDGNLLLNVLIWGDAVDRFVTFLKGPSA